MDGHVVFYLFFLLSSNNFLFQSPFNDIFDIQTYANVWGVPCDGIPDCEGGVDEHPSRCNVPKKITYSSLSIGFGIFFLIMLVILIYNRRKYVTSNKFKRFKSKYFMLMCIQDVNDRPGIQN